MLLDGHQHEGRLESHFPACKKMNRIQQELAEMEQNDSVSPVTSCLSFEKQNDEKTADRDRGD